jgi:hypothetical protein
MSMIEQKSQLTPETVIKTYQRAKERRRAWEQHWRECYDFALPLRTQKNQFGGQSGAMSGARTADKLFDGTAPDAVDQLAASLLSHLTPPWSRWVGLMPGAELSGDDAEAIAPKLETIAETIQSHFDRSNFTVEIHQCFLDLVTAGTACLMLEETPLGESSAFRFTAVPMFDVVFEDSAQGKLDGTLRRLELTPGELQKRYPHAPLMSARNESGLDEIRIPVIEAVIPDGIGYAYVAVAEAAPGLTSDATVLAEGRFETSPFINFRWLKAPGEIYGRSPVMKALPDIKTANKVVELLLKNASINVTGIWMADDDGVLNPANIRLVPGAIIPKAVGSKGLQPLQSPGRMDLSNIVLEDLRSRIRSSLLMEKLGQVGSSTMSATEVLERSSDVARVLGATYGRLQSELLSPLIERAMAILGRRGEIPSVRIDGRQIDIDYRSPLAKRQARDDAQNAIAWFATLQGLGLDGLAVIDGARAARWLARAFSIPEELIRSESEIEQAWAKSQRQRPEQAGGQNPLSAMSNTLNLLNARRPGESAETPVAQAVAPAGVRPVVAPPRASLSLNPGAGEEVSNG